MSSKGEIETRIVLIDDHEMVREGLSTLLAAHPDMEIVGSFASTDEFLAAPLSWPPDVVLVTLNLDGSAEEDVREIQTAYPACGVLALSASEEDAPILDIVRAGARGYIIKKASVGHLLNAIHIVARGGTYVSPELSKWFLERIQHSRNGPRRNLLGKLSPRELEVMRLVAQGKSSKEVAQELRLEVETVRSYRKNLMRKLGVNKVASLTRLAMSLNSASEEERAIEKMAAASTG